jgi:hypothetical protein
MSSDDRTYEQLRRPLRATVVEARSIGSCGWGQQRRPTGVFVAAGHNIDIGG